MSEHRKPRTIRCPNCRRLLALLHPDGSFEVSVAGRRVEVERGRVGCAQCGMTFEVDERRETVFRVLTS